jgi:hypothetical protein
VVAELAGDHDAAARVERELPEIGVCGGSGLFDDDIDTQGLLPPGDERSPGGRPGRHHRSAAGQRHRHDRDVLNHVETGQDAGVAVSLRGRVLAVLGLTQTVSWGVLYYAFPVLAPSISRDTGWSNPGITGRSPSP